MNDWLTANGELRVDPKTGTVPDSRAAYAAGRYKFARELCPGKSVLDAACGTGYGSAMVGEYARQVVGIDSSHEAIQYAQQSYGSQNVRFQKMFVESINLEPEMFDVVISFETLEHLLAPRTALLEFARLLTKNGIGIFSVPNSWGLTRHHFIDFDHALLKKLTTEVFQECSYFYYNSGERADTSLVGMGPLEEVEPNRVECVIAVCQSPRKELIPQNRQETLLAEIYENAFGRHHEYLDLQDRSIPVVDPAEITSSLPAIRAGDPLTLQAENFGEKPGRVQIQLPVEVLNWENSAVTLKVPAIAEKSISASQLNIVLNDGCVAASPMFRLIPAAS